MTSSPCFQFDRRRHLVLGGELDRIEDAQDLVEVAPGGHRVGERQLDLLVGADDEDRAHGRVVGGGAAVGGDLVGRQHVVELGDLEIVVGDHRVLDRRALRFLDVLRPGAVAVDRVGRQADQLGVSFRELGLDLGHVAELGRAHRGEVLRVRKEDRPFVADPVVEADLSLGRLGFEIGGGVVDAQGHGDSPGKGFAFAADAGGQSMPAAHSRDGCEFYAATGPRISSCRRRRA